MVGCRVWVVLQGSIEVWGPGPMYSQALDCFALPGDVSVTRPDDIPDGCLGSLSDRCQNSLIYYKRQRLGPDWSRDYSQDALFSYEYLCSRFVHLNHGDVLCKSIFLTLSRHDGFWRFREGKSELKRRPSRMIARRKISCLPHSKIIFQSIKTTSLVSNENKFFCPH